MISSLIHLEIYIVLFVGRGTSISCSKLPALLSQLNYEVSPIKKFPSHSKFSSFLILLILKSPHSKLSSFQILLTSKFHFSKFSSVFCRQIFMGKLLEKAVSKSFHTYVHPKFLKIHFSLHIFEGLGDVIDGSSQDTHM